MLLLFRMTHLYGCDGGNVGLQNGDGCTGAQTPHSDNLVAAGWGQEAVLVVHRHVADLCRVAAQRRQESAVVCGPDFHEAVVGPLTWDEEIFQLGVYFFKDANGDSFDETEQTHCKYPPTCAVKGYTVDWGEVAEDTLVYLHVLVGGRRQRLAKTSRARGLASTHDGCLKEKHDVINREYTKK